MKVLKGFPYLNLLILAAVHLTSAAGFSMEPQCLHETESVSSVSPTSLTFEASPSVLESHGKALARLRDIIYSKLRGRPSGSGNETLTYSDLKLFGVSKEEVTAQWVKAAENTSLENARRGRLDDIFVEPGPVELSVAVNEYYTVDVIRSDTPEKMDTLTPDILLALRKLDEAYKSQDTNTVDVFDEQAHLKGKTIYYLVAKDKQGIVAGLFAIIVGSPKNPTSVSQFGIIDNNPVQIEFGKTLVLQSGQHVFPSLVVTAVSFLRQKNVDPETPIYFWADQPSWALNLKKMGAPELAVGRPGIWVFRAPFKSFIEKFFRNQGH